jgi:hypothetical protein
MTSVVVMNWDYNIDVMGSVGSFDAPSPLSRMTGCTLYVSNDSRSALLEIAQIGKLSPLSTIVAKGYPGGS